MKEILLKAIKDSIKKWNKKDIYAISLFVQDEDDNPCKPTVTLGYNTNAKVKKEIKNACNEAEAKWNYAFWLQNEKMVFGTGKTEGVVRDWILSNGLTYAEDIDIYGEDSYRAEELLKVTSAFVNLLVEIVQELHSSGFITEQFGKEIPVLIHELEYYDQIAEQNVRANSAALVEDFTKFCIGEE